MVGRLQNRAIQGQLLNVYTTFSLQGKVEWKFTTSAIKDHILDLDTELTPPTGIHTKIFKKVELIPLLSAPPVRIWDALLVWMNASSSL